MLEPSRRLNGSNPKLTVGLVGVGYRGPNLSRVLDAILIASPVGNHAGSASDAEALVRR